MKARVNIIWFRRDLRLTDQAALYHALKSGLPVVPVFIFDRSILDQLEDKADKRVAFIHAVLVEMQHRLSELDTTLEVYHGFPVETFQSLLEKYHVETVFVNHDYEPYALKRDKAIAALLEQNGSQMQSFKDQVIFEKNEVVKDDTTPYTVFTPYAKKWRAKLNEFYISSYPTDIYFSRFFRQQPQKIPRLEELGFHQSETFFPSRELKEDNISHYTSTRNYPGLADGTSRMGIHLRFGTVSIRVIARKALILNSTYLNELIWRDFYQMILWHFPAVGTGRSFKPAYEFIEWRNNEHEFDLWCHGMTGYPIVDAGMRQLNATGYMHNRVRMIVASFLTKHLLIDWRWGEAYFAQKLLDYDLAANNGGWQWASGSGCDAAPYFRIFNPALQTMKFDKDLSYISKWVPEFQEFSYPKPVVQHEIARKRALEVYARALKK